MMARSLSTKSRNKSAPHGTIAVTALIILCASMWLILLPLTDFNPLAVCPGLIGILYVLERTA